MALHRYRDPASGLEVVRLTDGEGPSRKTYFTNESWTVDDRWIVYLAWPAAGGPAGVWRLEEASGEREPLTEGPGWAAHTLGLDRRRDVAFLQREGALWLLELGGAARATEVAAAPPGARPTGHFTVSRSGLVACGYKLREGPFGLAVFDPQTGGCRIVFRSDTPLGHVQFCPGDDRTIFYVHETGGDALQRMWLFDLELSAPQALYPEGPEDWITHETWGADGSLLTFIRWPHAILAARRAADGQAWGRAPAYEVVAVGRYHHCAPSANARWVAADMTETGEVWLVPWGAGPGRPRLLASGVRARSGEDHCHPSFNRRGDRVLFSAPGSGPCQIALVDLRQIDGFEP
jgi:oligogalacturonide lyase